jgi:hypothetical protein
MSDQKIVTEPHNPFLLETFRAFLAEGLPVPVATAMVQSHIAHAHAKAAIDQASALVRIANSLARIDYSIGRISDLTDPVDLGRFLALVRAGDDKRTETAKTRKETEVAESFDRTFGPSNAELAS